ncbi:MAG: hypothetical protein LBS36_13655 [Oscillospiraceae bacterium]|nr:hypothetical protein [Oscillospiraceae bacterium]
MEVIELETDDIENDASNEEMGEFTKSIIFVVETDFESREIKISISKDAADVLSAEQKLQIVMDHLKDQIRKFVPFTLHVVITFGISIFILCATIPDMFQCSNRADIPKSIANFGRF